MTQWSSLAVVAGFGLVALGRPALAADDSEAARGKKHLGFGVEYGLIDQEDAPGANVFFDLGKEFQLGVFASMYAKDVASTVRSQADSALAKNQAPDRSTTEGVLAYYFGDAATAKVKSTLYMLDARLFPATNSFYVHVGAGERVKTADVTGLDYTAHLEATTILGYVGVGNQWTWGNGVYFGVDWIGVYIPVSSKAKGTYSNPDLAAEAAADPAFASIYQTAVDMETSQAGSDLGKLRGAEVLVANVGWSF